MMIVAAVSAVVPVVLMYDWAWSATIGAVGSLASLILAAVAMFMDGGFSLGAIIIYLLPPIFLFMDMFRLRSTYLVYDRKRLF